MTFSTVSVGPDTRNRHTEAWPEDVAIVSRESTSEKVILNEEGTQGQYVYNVTDETAVSGHIFKYIYMNGSLDHHGGDLIVHYLDEDGHKIYKEKYGGKMSRCPAPFLNRYMKTAMLIGNTAEVSSFLQSLKPDGSDEAKPFQVRGQGLTYDSGKMADGRDWHMTFTYPIIKVNEISI